MTIITWTQTRSNRWRVEIDRSRRSVEHERFLRIMNLLGLKRGDPREKQIGYLVQHGCKASGIAVALWAPKAVVERLRAQED